MRPELSLCTPPTHVVWVQIGVAFKHALLFGAGFTLVNRHAVFGGEEIGLAGVAATWAHDLGFNETDMLGNEMTVFMFSRLFSFLSTGTIFIWVCSVYMN
jgi:hypothetical protein